MYRSLLLALSLVANSAAWAAEDSCLSQRWAEFPPTDAERAFDMAHDLPTTGGISSISCWADATPSALQRSVANLKAALQNHDLKLLQEQFKFPLLINEEKKHSRAVQREDFQKNYDTIFSPDLVNYISSLNFDDVMVAGYRGAALGNGFMWWEADKADGRPKFVAINPHAPR